MMTDPQDKVLPGEHSHADRPNWRPAESIEEYLANCREGLEKYSEKHACELLGVTRIQLWRIRIMASIPDSLFDFILMRARTKGIRITTKMLAQVGHALSSGNNQAEVECCPHCGSVLRARSGPT
jgi:hypothetical protein